MQWNEAVSLWKQSLRSPYTQHSFGVAVSEFFKWSGEDLGPLSIEALESWVWYLADRATPIRKLGGSAITSGTMNKYLLALKLFLKYCHKKGWNDIPLEALEETLKKWPSSVTRPYMILDDLEIKRIMEAARIRRDRCILALGLFAGLRNFEIANLQAQDVRKDEQGAYVIVHGKGNKEAAVPIAEDVYELLKSYAPLNGRMWQISPVSLRTMVKKTAKKAGIEKHITPHSLRHTYAFRLAKKEVPVLVISKLLRHSNLAVTTGYLAHLSRDDTARYAPEMPT